MKRPPLLGAMLALDAMTGAGAYGITNSPLVAHSGSPWHPIPEEPREPTPADLQCIEDARLRQERKAAKRKLHNNK